MKFFCIADEDTVRGFRLAGIAGEVVTTPGEAVAAIEKAAAETDNGIIILTENVVRDISSFLDNFRLQRSSPLLVEIPGPAGPLPGRKTLRQMAQGAIGISVEREESF